jgi:site-specific recombinase XerD
VKALERYSSDARPYLVHDPMEQAFFLSRNGRRLSPPSMQAMLRNYGKTAGIPHRVHPHVLRHAYATHLLERGADIRHIQELLGHRFIQTTALYTHVEPKDLRKVIRKAHPRERTRRRSKKGKGKRR